MAKEFKQGEIYKLTPQEAMDLVKKRHVLRWLDKKEGHDKGEPKIRRYEYLGRHKVGKKKKIKEELKVN